MDYKRILTIQDISCLGQCSLTVALPILSACGMETCVLPSAVLSTHTAGFTGYTFRDLTEDMPAICAHWKSEGITYDAFYTGYLGSTRQIDYVREIMDTCSRPGALRIIDPACADNGKLYPGFDDAFVEAMKGLCADADYILPNITEACLLTGIEFRTVYDEAYIDSLLSALSQLCSKATVILTGVGYTPDTTGVVVYRDGEKEYYCHKHLDAQCHGTGDVFAASFTGALLRGFKPIEASKIAADYTVACMKATLPDENHKYGVKFELKLPELMEALKGEEDPYREA